VPSWWSRGRRRSGSGNTGVREERHGRISLSLDLLAPPALKRGEGGGGPVDAEIGVRRGEGGAVCYPDRGGRPSE
jgi:hypothetical protein